MFSLNKRFYERSWNEGFFKRVHQAKYSLSLRKEVLEKRLSKKKKRSQINFEGLMETLEKEEGSHLWRESFLLNLRGERARRNANDPKKNREDCIRFGLTTEFKKWDLKLEIRSGHRRIEEKHVIQAASSMSSAMFDEILLNFEMRQNPSKSKLLNLITSCVTQVYGLGYPK